MQTSHPNSVVQKRDLHVGGLGSSASGALAAVDNPAADGSWVRKLRDAAQNAKEHMRGVPWATLAAAAAIGAVAGYLLARRSKP